MTPFYWSRKNRVFLTYGRTNERFCLPSGVEVRFERCCTIICGVLGYKIVLFFSNRGAFFLDTASQQPSWANQRRRGRPSPRGVNASEACAPQRVELAAEEASAVTAGNRPRFDSAMPTWPTRL